MTVDDFNALGIDDARREIRPALDVPRWVEAIVAEGFHPEVLMTLAANRRALHAPVVAAAADARERSRLAELTGAEQLSTADLQAGYVPDHALGRADTWASTARNCWVEPQHGS